MRFRDDYFFLSNFYPCDVKIEGDLTGTGSDIVFPSSENAYHYFRSDNPKTKEKFITHTPLGAKKLAKRCKAKPNWDDIKLGVMYYVVKQKFIQNPDLAAKLISTGNEMLIEHNWWRDTFWGVCNGIGENNLGMILMRIRAELWKDHQPSDVSMSPVSE